MTHAALSAVLIAVCSWITVPAAVPFTLQTFAVFTVLRAPGRQAAACAPWRSICCWARQACRCSPASARAWARSFGPTGGYILGFAFAALAMWGVQAKFGDRAMACARRRHGARPRPLLRLRHGVVHDRLRARERPHRSGSGAFHVRAALHSPGLRKDCPRPLCFPRAFGRCSRKIRTAIPAPPAGCAPLRRSAFPRFHRRGGRAVVRPCRCPRPAPDAPPRPA